MKAVLFVVVIVGAAALVGWLRFSAGDGTASVTVDTEKVQEDAGEAVDKGKELFQDSTNALDNAVNGDDDETQTRIEVEVEETPAEELDTTTVRPER